MLVFCLLCVIAEQFSVLTLHDPVQWQKFSGLCYQYKPSIKYADITIIDKSRKLK